MKIKVTKEHIDRGTPNTCTRCPIALAVHDLFPDYPVVAVGNDYINVYGYALLRRSFKLPPEAKEFITRVDAELSVDPIEFEAEEVVR